MDGNWKHTNFLGLREQEQCLQIIRQK